jgi:hypothetical protein
MSVHGRPVVVIERLRLQGFGRHRDLELHFPAGLATWVAPNEAGKSTAILGLVATLCGVPHLQEPSGFTWGRFRSHQGGPYRGEVDLRRGEARYQIERHFDQHSVQVFESTPAGRTLLFAGEHNPNARREVSGYTRWLRATLGIDDASLLLATFVVAQGDLAGAPQQLSERVQALLAGAGGGTAADAIAQLEGALRGVTRKLRDLAPTFTRDGRVDQSLDVAEARLAELRQRHREGVGLADELAGLQRAAERTSAAARAALVEAQRSRHLAVARQAWIDRREGTLRALRRARDLDRVLEAARALEARLSEQRVALERLHPELVAQATDGLEERIAAWARAEEALRDQQGRSERARLALEQLRGACELEWAAAERAPLEQQGGAPDGAPGGAPFGDASRRHRQAEVAVRRYAQLLAQGAQVRAHVREADATLARLAPLEGLDPAQRAALPGHRQEAARLRARLEGASERHAEWAQALREAQERFGVVVRFGEPVAAALEHFKRVAHAPDPAEPWRWIGALLLSGTLAAVGIGLALADPLPVVAAAGGAGVVWLLLWPRQPRLVRARRRLRELVAEEPALYGDDAHLLELADRHAAYRSYGDDIERFAASEREAAERLADASALWEAFEARWAAVHRALRGASGGALVDLEGAAEELIAARKLRAEADALAAVVVEAAGVERLAALDDGAPAAGSGHDGALLLAFAGERLGLRGDASVGELQRALAAAGAARWGAWRREAELEDARAAQQARLAALGAQQAQQLDNLTRVLDEELVAEGECREAVRRACTAAHAGFPAGVAWPNAAALRLAFRERTALVAAEKAQVEQLQTHLRAVGAVSVAGLEEMATLADYEVRRQHEAWEALLLEHPDLPPADLEVGTDEAASHPGFAAATAAAAAAEGAAERARSDALVAAEALARAQGGDPIDVAAVELEMEELAEEIRDGRLQRDALALALQALQRASHTTLEGQARRLEVAATAHLGRLSGVTGRRVRCDAEMRIGAVEASGVPLSVAQLSQGARDQLALALRFAIRDLIADQVALPMILDDPFLNWDGERAAAAAAALRREVAGGEQLWLVSHRPELADWGEPVRVRDASG